MEMKVQKYQLTAAGLNLQILNGLFVNHGYRCTAQELTSINGYAVQINKILENRSKDNA